MQNRLINSIVLAFSLLAWCSCSSSNRLSSDFEQKDEPPTSVDYSIIYMIHGDASYLYHDSDGNARQADEDVFDEAVAVAKKARHGEVFIFHQKPERKILWLFPKKDRVFLHYRNGQLIHRKKYSPEDSSLSFVAESRLYQQHRMNQPEAADHRKMFLYFGHEIPRVGDRRYHSSRPAAPFSTATFSRGLRSFLASDGDSFDLTVLSTCNNGTPDMAASLLPHTNYLLASPQNLHLSHIDTRAFSQLGQKPEIDTYELAINIADQTYERLTEFIQTAVSLSLYRLDRTEDYLQDLASLYARYLESSPTKHESSADNTDCSLLPFFDRIDRVPGGVRTWYKAPRFGRKTDTQHHSGWGCKR